MRWRNLSAWAATEGTLRVVAVPREAWTPFFERLVLERETGLPRSTPSARSFLRTALQITGAAGLPRGTLSVAHDAWWRLANHAG